MRLDYKYNHFLSVMYDKRSKRVIYSDIYWVSIKTRHYPRHIGEQSNKNNSQKTPISLFGGPEEGD